MQHVTRIQPEELPDGSFFTPQKILSSAQGSNLAQDDTVVRAAEYISSFPVEGSDQRERAEFVRQKLETLRFVPQSQPVLLIVSLTGIKVCGESGESVLMAHALRRISYATCDPESCHFSFLAREPKGQSSVQYCHAFGTETPEQAEELNKIVGDAFKRAFAQQRQSQPQPTFNDVIERQLQASRTNRQREEEVAQEELNKNLRRISTASVMDFVAQRKEHRQKTSSTSEDPPAPSATAAAAAVLSAEVVVSRRHPRQASASGGATGGLPPPAPGLGVGGDIANGGGQHSSSAVLILKPGTTSIHPSLDAPLDMGMDLKGFGSPVVAIKERLDAEAAANQMMMTSTISASSSSCTTKQQSTAVTASSSSKQPASVHPTPAAVGSSSSSGQQQQPCALAGSDATPPRFYFNTKHQQQQHPQQQSRISSQLDVPGVVSGGGGAIGCSGRIISDEMEEELPPVPPVRFNSLRKYDSTPHERERPSHILQASGIPAPPDFDPPSPPGPPHPATIWQPAAVPAPAPAPTSRIDEEAAAEPVGEWYQAAILREIALEVLVREEVGRFVVRDSSSHPGCYALSVKVPKFDNPSGITHYLIQRTQRGVKLKGLEKEWPSLRSLVTHLTVIPEMLPCTLKMPPRPTCFDQGVLSSTPACLGTSHTPAAQPPLPPSSPPLLEASASGGDAVPDHPPGVEEYQRLSDFSSIMADLGGVAS